MSVEHKSGLAVAAIVLLGAMSPHRAIACAMAFAHHKVGSSFVIAISYNGRPLPGIEVEISRETDKEPYLVHVMSTRSDERGQSLIRGLDQGSYFLVVKHAGIEGEAVELKVVNDEQTDAFVEGKLELSWPNRKVFKIREVAGMLFRTPFDFTKRSTEPPLSGSKVTLTDAFTATQRSVSIVQNDGSFGFANLDAGLYILHIKQGQGTRQSGDLEEEIDGYVFVEVVPDAADHNLPLLRLYMSDCGMGMRGKDGNEIF